MITMQTRIKVVMVRACVRDSAGPYSVVRSCAGGQRSFLLTAGTNTSSQNAYAEQREAKGIMHVYTKHALLVGLR